MLELCFVPTMRKVLLIVILGAFVRASAWTYPGNRTPRPRPTIKIPTQGLIDGGARTFTGNHLTPRPTIKLSTQGLIDGGGRPYPGNHLTPRPMMWAPQPIIKIPKWIFSGNHLTPRPMVWPTPPIIEIPKWPFSGNLPPIPTIKIPSLAKRTKIPVKLIGIGCMLGVLCIAGGAVIGCLRCYLYCRTRRSAKHPSATDEAGKCYPLTRNAEYRPVETRDESRSSCSNRQVWNQERNQPGTDNPTQSQQQAFAWNQPADTVDIPRTNTPLGPPPSYSDVANSERATEKITVV